MTIAVNGSRSGIQNLYDLVNASSPGHGFTTNNISFGPATAITDAVDNTSVLITPLSNKGYRDAVTRNYTRRNAGISHNKTGAMKVLISPANTQSEIRDKIVAAVGCIGADVDIVGNGTANAFKIPENEDDTSCTFTINAKAGSYVYVGSFTAQLTVPDIDVPLETAIPNQSLGGFTVG